MTRARAVIVAILAVSLGLGVLMWWLQTRAYYREVLTGGEGATLLQGASGGMVEVGYLAFETLIGDSSPIRNRGCLTLADPEGVTAALPAYEAPTPLIAPGWFRCFDAGAITEALEAGEARAVLWDNELSRPYGVDEVAAVFPDGRAFTWRQINPCGEAVYNGRPPPEGCPPPPDDVRLNYAPDED